MVRAAAKGLIDYATCDPYDRWWWARHDLFIQEHEEEAYRNIFDRKSRHWTALLAAAVDKDFRNEAANHASAALDGYIELEAPWLELPKGARTPATLEEFDAAYAEEFGQPGEPEYEKMTQDLVALLAKLSDKGKLRQKLRGAGGAK